MSEIKISYDDFVRSKIKLAQFFGFDVAKNDLHNNLKPHQKDSIVWSLKGGRRAIFASFGLGKTRIQLEILRQIHKHEGGKFLIICPLGVKQEFTISDGPALGMDNIVYVRTNQEIAECESPFMITNYERVRDGDIDVNQFTGITLDEASCLRSYGSKTYQEFLKLFFKVKYRFVATATPSPNKFKELIHYAGFLGVMDTGQALTRFFQRDSTKANNLTLYPHKEKEFWLWVASWALFIDKPSDLGYDDTGYALPEIEIKYHIVKVNHQTAGFDSWGQGKLFRDAAISLRDAAKEKRDTIDVRLEKALEIISNSGEDRHWLLWHNLEDERHAISKALPEAKVVFGTQDLDKRENLIMDFSFGKYRILATKPEIAGSGCNFQRHCHDAIFMGIDYKFNDLIQAIHRIYRFLQDQKVTIHIILAESEREILKTIDAKWKRHNEMLANMKAIVRKYGLTNTISGELMRTIGIERQEVVGKNFTCVNNDTYHETKMMEDNSVDMLLTSIPFSNHYEYTPSYEDFGHNENNDEFFKQMDFIIPEWLRVLKPGRVAAVHTKDRILFGNATGMGMPSVDPFSDLTVAAMRKHGFVYCGRITINTDVVRENNQTYRLGWTENSKDGTKMGVGCPEYVLLFRKLPTDTSRAYADEPVIKSKVAVFQCQSCSYKLQDDDKGLEMMAYGSIFLGERKLFATCPSCNKKSEFIMSYAGYNRARWQIDAHAFWRSSGNRLPLPEEISTWNIKRIMDWWKKYNHNHIYDYKAHIELGSGLEAKGKLPAVFMLFAPIAHHPEVWDDVQRMRTLNGEQSHKNLQMHVCPLQFDIVDRLIERYSNEGELIFDPFGGLMTVVYRAIKLRRRGKAVEISSQYFKDGITYCRAAEMSLNAPTLFDDLELEAGQYLNGNIVAGELVETIPSLPDQNDVEYNKFEYHE